MISYAGLKKMVAISAFGLTLASCVTLGHGKVSKVVGDQEAEVTVLDDYVKTGDKVSLYARDPFASKTKDPTIKLGEGTVTKVSGNTATVKVDGNVRLTDVSGTIFVQRPNDSDYWGHNRSRFGRK